MDPSKRLEYSWIAYRDGDPRRYASAVPWSEEFVEVLKSHGFTIRRLEVSVPDRADEVMQAAASRE